ncbi:MAG TPA: MBOAT family O-acyltransferase [Acidobacteriaceae bacterium]|jgi:alginate O-acetyltransferase complex protein AlgI
MIFNTFAYYLLFLLPAATLYRCSRDRVRPWIIAVFGCGFFLYFAYSMAGVWGALCLGIFLWESITSRLYKPGSRWCLLGLVQSLLLLGFFKYWNFFTGLLFWHHANPVRWQSAFLPLGISFFTFEFYHYAWDRRAGRTEQGTLAEYLAFILFFPTMVAGPIKRYQDFLPKLRAKPRDWSSDWEFGLTRILTGLAKKFAIADLMTAWTNHLNAHDIPFADRRMLLVWLFAYGVKIYADFSAYSDIAIGSARLFGIGVPENFDWPYGRRNIQRFWQCWHISLTRWLMDYVYIPLGGSRVAPVRIYINIMLVMLVSGLWHGAGLNFLIWGLWHGLLLALHRGWRKWRGEPSTRPLPVFASRVVTLIAVNAGWAFFCMDLHTVTLFYRRLLAV